MSARPRLRLLAIGDAWHDEGRALTINDREIVLTRREAVAFAAHRAVIDQARDAFGAADRACDALLVAILERVAREEGRDG